MEKSVIGVFVKHDGCNKEFLFSVDPFMRVRKGDIVLVDTMQGPQVGTVTSDIFESPNLDEIAVRFGAYLPLKKVLQVCGPELQQYMINKTVKAINDELQRLVRPVHDPLGYY